ncbi:undecaprenyl phosphate-alpha-4-amino-4-deoxy-L-arabinose arabinosyl transferase [Ferrovum sp. JA12]|uniref:glycosyltransferase family 39 protein n=1 Tax=Ferrovum sp. JA12 TaxID=1356299 RepID=UPI00070348A7|nr:glycosyltransferase family 39 protein [Ferrovum sp. JA12]KRH78386.1 undecaprenyl phosphate-alpha-4-amino-4-deoxy-L-arabinose arabinosyl transferase [Ferrovum sp. JA12]
MRAVLVLLLLVTVIWGAGLSSRSLMRPDEGRYAEIAREMAISQDWTSPRLNHILYFEKPPLQYWASAAAIRALGVNNFSPRLWGALCGLLGIFLVALTAHRLWGRNAALSSAAVLSSSLYYVALGHINTLDMGVSFFITLAVCAFILSIHENQRRYMWLAWIAAGLAFLSKGLIGLVLPGLGLIATTLITRRFQVWRKIQPLPGFILFSLVTLPWLWVIQRAHPSFFHFFFIHEHLQRFTTTLHRRVEPVWYFLPILLVGFLPWTLLLFRSLTEALCAPFRRDFSVERFLAVFIIVVVVFFSLSDSKLPSYLLPIFPALALITGRYIAQRQSLPQSAPLTGLAWGSFLLFAGAVLHFPHWGTVIGIHPDLDADMVIPYQHFGEYLMFAGALWLMYFVLHQRLTRLNGQLVVMGLCGLVSTQILLVGSQTLSPISSMEGVANELRVPLHEASQIYSVQTYDQTLDYYLQRTVTLVDFKDELAMGLELEPQRSIASLEEFKKIWDKDRGAVAIMEPNTYLELAAKGFTMRLIYKDFRHVIVARI